MPITMQEGYNACLHGERILANPHAFTHKQNELKVNQWEIGYLKAKKDLEEGKAVMVKR